MESEFEPAVRMEETPEARIVIVEVPGFRTEDLRVQVNNRGNLIVSGERRVKETEEKPKAGVRIEKTQSRGQKFRKVINIPETLNIDDITAKLRDQVLRITLPFVKTNEKSPVKGGEKLHAADLSEQSKPDQRSSPVKAQGLVQERPAPAENDQSARLPEVKRPDDSEAKARAAAEKSKAEGPKQAEEFVHGEPLISTQAQAVSAQTGSERAERSEVTQGKSEQPKKEDESCLPSPNVQIPEKLIKFPSSLRCSMVSNRRILITSAVLVLSAGMYLSYTLRSRKEE